VTTPPPPARAPQKKILGLPVPVAIGLGAAVLAGAYFWWKRHKAASTTATSASTSATRTSATSSADVTGELQELQAEIDELTGAAGTGAASTTKTTKTTSTAPPSIPGPVTGLTVSNVTATSATLSWNKTPGAVLYLIGNESTVPATDLANTPNTSYTLTGLKPNTSYTIGVAAQSSASGHAAVSFKTKAS
jgi:hypothetical protein